MKLCRVVVLGVFSAGAFACSLPTPTVPNPRLTADDFKVFAAVINDKIRKPREFEFESPKQSGLKANPPRLLLVANETLKTCDSQDADYRRCVYRDLMPCLTAYPAAVQHRSRQSYVINAGFAPDILIMDTEYYFTLFSGPLGDRFTRISEGLRQRYPRGENVGVVFFSVPLYPTAREAVVMMRRYSLGESCLLLRLNTNGWSVERTLHELIAGGRPSTSPDLTPA